MPLPPWRFTAGDTAYARPCTSNREVTLIEQHPHTDPKTNIICPHWKVRDRIGEEWVISQLELSSRAGVLKPDGSAKMLKGATK